MRQHPTALEVDLLKPESLQVIEGPPPFNKLDLHEGSLYIKTALNYCHTRIIMKTLGINTASSEVRFALISFTNDTPTLLNAASENRLRFPADCEDTGEKAKWLYEELERILETHPDIESMVIRMNGYGMEKKATRISSHLDGVALLSAKLHDINVAMMLNSQLGINQKQVRSEAENHVGKTDKYWNDSMAYAIIAALEAKDIHE